MRVPSPRLSKGRGRVVQSGFAAELHQWVSDVSGVRVAEFPKQIDSGLQPRVDRADTACSQTRSPKEPSMAVNLSSGALAALNRPAASEVAAIAMLKKAITLQEQNTAQVLQTLPPTPAANAPHLGNHIDVFA
jgi:hypothetical protein